MRDRKLMLQLLRDLSKTPNGITQYMDIADIGSVACLHLQDLGYVDLCINNNGVIHSGRLKWQGYEFLERLDEYFSKYIHNNRVGGITISYPKEPELDPWCEAQVALDLEARNKIPKHGGH